jgi:hypothetical protein
MNSGAHGPGESGYPGARAEGHARPVVGLADSWFALGPVPQCVGNKNM